MTVMRVPTYGKYLWWIWCVTVPLGLLAAFVGH